MTPDQTRYPPQGVHGVGSALARASSFNCRAAYASTEGVDSVFIGPADLAAHTAVPATSTTY